MGQWGGNLNYRPEARKAASRREKKAQPKPTPRGEERATASAANEFRVGRTIAGSTNDARRRNLEHIALRKRRQRRNAIIFILILLACGGLAFAITQYLDGIAKEREAAMREANPIEPTLPIVDENVGNNISQRTKSFIARLEADLKDFNLQGDHIVLPFQKAREIVVYIKNRKEYYKLSLERGSAVQAEDISRMITYLDGKNLKPKYVDLRVEGKAYYK